MPCERPGADLDEEEEEDAILEELGQEPERLGDEHASELWRARRSAATGEPMPRMTSPNVCGLRTSRREATEGAEGEHARHGCEQAERGDVGED